MTAWIVATTAMAFGRFEVAWAGWGVTAGLLVTTPAGAIRLPRLVSEIAILGLYGTAGHFSNSILVGTVFWLLAARTMRRSPWCAALFCFDPLLSSRAGHTATAVVWAATVLLIVASPKIDRA